MRADAPPPSRMLTFADGRSPRARRRSELLARELLVSCSPCASLQRFACLPKPPWGLCKLYRCAVGLISSVYLASDTTLSSPSIVKAAAFDLRSSLITHSRQGSSSSQDTFDGTAKPDDEIKELPADDRPSASWAEQASTAQAPALTYHATPSASTLSSASGIFECYAAEPVRKRFKAPFQSHILDREVGNPKPWMNGRTTVKRDKRSYFTTLFGIFVGLALGIFVIVKDALHVDHYNYCPVLDDEFNGDSLDHSKCALPPSASSRVS